MGPVSLATMGPASRERRPRGVPRLPRDLLERRALLDRLHAAVGNGLIVLQAPAGFGKTTLAAAFVRELERDFDACWLSVDATCSTQEAFAERLAHAVLGPEAWAPVSISLGEDYRSYLAGILARWYETCTAAPLLVLDSLDQLEREAPAWALVEWVAEFTRERGEVLLLSREPLARRGFDRRVASGEASVFSAADLAFTLEEVEALCAATATDVDPAELFDATGGWPIAVMAVLRGAVSFDDVRSGATAGSWERYLMQEVWRSVPQGLRPLLRRLAVVPDCDARVGVELVGEEGWRKAVSWASEAGFAVESREGGIRFTPLFRQILLSELRQDPEAAAEAADIAVRAYRALGNPTLSLAAATELSAREWIARLIREDAQELIDRGAFDLLNRAFELLPDRSVQEDATLRALRARAWSLAGRPEDALREAELILDSDVPTEPRFHALLAAVRASRLLGRFADALRYLDAANRVRDRFSPDQQLELDWYRAHGLMALASDFTAAREILSSLLARSASRPAFGLLASSALGQLYGMQGDAPRAIDALARAAAGWRKLGATGNLPWVLNNLSMAHLAAGDTESARAAATDAVREARRTGNDRAVAYGLASLADALYAAGDAPAARSLYRRALSLCETRVRDDALAALAITGLAAAAAREGDLVEADVYAKRANLVADALGSPFEIAWCRLNRAAVSSAGGAHTEALSHCEEAIRLARRTGALGLLRAALYRAAMCAFRSRQRQRAIAYLRDLAAVSSEAWHAAALRPLAREDPLFAQWAAGQGVLPQPLAEALPAETFAASGSPVSHAVVNEYPHVRVESLGRLAIYKDGKIVSPRSFASMKAIEFFLLFLARRDGLEKEQAVVALYPDVPPWRCNSAFHSNLYRVRRALYQECIVKDGQRYVLNPEASFDWDVAEFRHHLSEARRSPPGSRRRAELLEEAVRCYRGPFATTVHSEWAAALRAELDRQAVEAFATLAGYHAGRGQFEEACAYLERVLEADPLNDEAAFHLARFKAKAGDTVAALALIDRFTEALTKELGEPVPERLRRLRSQIATGAVS